MQHVYSCVVNHLPARWLDGSALDCLMLHVLCRNVRARVIRYECLWLHQERITAFFTSIGNAVLQLKKRVNSHRREFHIFADHLYCPCCECCRYPTGTSRSCVRIFLAMYVHSSDRMYSHCCLLTGMMESRFPRLTRGSSSSFRCVFNSSSVMMRFSLRT